MKKTTRIRCFDSTTGLQEYRDLPYEGESGLDRMRDFLAVCSINRADLNEAQQHLLTLMVDAFEELTKDLFAALDAKLSEPKTRS